ncbi:MAG TPA: substrate-binding domain-containing protein, partial [Sphingobacteriaceae bacterium]|nr:substrate-binding domain-containing protein [Sphingobacteriaceae bacterium]
GAVEDLIQNDLPVVLFDRYLPHLDTDYVIVDNYRGAYEASRHFLDQDFKKIAFVTLESTQTQMTDRLQGYLDALAEEKMASLVKVIPAWKEEQSAIDDFSDFYDQHKPDAIFFSANHIAIIGLKAFQQKKAPWPGIISFDDHTFFRLSNPTITVVSQPISQIAEEVIQILINKLAGKVKNRQKIVLPTQLIVRQSSLKQTS